MPSITAVQVAPANPSIANGTAQQFTATLLFSDGSKQDATQLVTWASSSDAIATVGNAAPAQGLAQSHAVGTATIKATYQGNAVGSTQITVTPAVITGLAITPAAPSIANGTTQQFVATATFSDNTHQPVTSDATWSTADASIATISNTAGSNGLAQSLQQGTTTVAATYLGQNASVPLTVTPATLVSLAITPADSTVAKGFKPQFTATGTYTDKTQQNLTSSVTWASSDVTVATINNSAGHNGEATTLTQGSTTITATSGNIQASTKLTVGPIVLTTISVAPDSPSVPKGTTQQLKATGSYSDNTTQDLTASVTWASSDTNIADVSNAAGSQGLAAAKNIGPAKITATSGTVSGSTTLTVTDAVLVSLQVTPVNSSVAAGFKRQFTATGIYSDSTNRDVTDKVNWVSTDSSVAAISNATGSNGLATGLKAGSVTISAQSGSIQNSTNLAVTGATLRSLSVTPASMTLPKGRNQQYAVTGTFSDNSTQDLTSQVAWSSSDTTIASINPNGLATAVAAAGSATITATSTTTPSGTKQGTATLTVTNADVVSIQVAPTSASIAKGNTQAFTAQAQYSDGSSLSVTTQVNWSSSDTTIATISNAASSQGIAKGQGKGGATIFAKMNNFSGTTISGSATLNVTDAVLTSLAISPNPVSVAKGIAVQFAATGTYSDATTKDLTAQVTWSSSDATVASISNAAGSQGVASTLKPGSADIVAATSGAGGTTIQAPSAKLTVTDAALQSIAVTPANSTIGISSSQLFTAIGTYSDATTKDLTTQVTWSSNNTAVADISNSAGSQGKAVAKTQGTVTIRAIDPVSSVTGQTGLTVGPAALQSISITPPDTGDGQVPSGFKRSFRAIGHYADNTTQDLTNSVTWTSFNPNVLTISDAAGSKGVATGVSVGSVIITAQNGSISANKTVTVNNATVSSISVTPANVTLSGSGKTQQYTAIATFSDNETLDVTTQVTWSSSDTSAATISNTAGSQGLATTKQVVTTTTTTISATVGGKTGSTSLTVTF